MALGDHGHARALTLACAEKALLVVSAGNRVVQLIPDLLVSRQDIRRACDILPGTVAGLREAARAAVIA